MISVDIAEKAVGMMSLMKFFPSNDGFKAALMELISEMCSTDDQVLWLARRVLKLHREWPGAHELRAALCSKYRPKDGIEADSQVYLDGVPSETGRLEMEPAKLGAAEATRLLAEYIPVVKSLPSAKPEADPSAAERSLGLQRAAAAELREEKPETVQEVKC